MFDGFEGKVIVVTGGSSGIGEATIARFHALNAAVIFNLDLDPPTTNLEAAEYIQCNMADPISVRKAVGSIIQAHGRIDVLFANAGIHKLGDIEETSDQDLERIINTNIKGTWYVIQAVIRKMREKGSGAIVINGSDQSLTGRPKSAAYGLTKGAIGQLTKSLALDYSPFGIRINCVCPSAIDTPLCRKAILDWANKYGGNVEKLMEAEHQNQPIGRMGSTADVAALVTFLASDDAKNITGALYLTDGGYLAR